MIHFDYSKFDKVKETYENWWNKKGTSVICGGVVPKYDGGKLPDKPLIAQTNVHLNFTAKEVIDSIEYRLSTFEYIGDAYPYFNMDCFGPGVIAAFIGCDMDNNNGQTGVWFKPKEKIDISKFNPKYDGDNPVFKRLKEIYKEGAKRFEGKVILSMPDLGGIADILSSFYPGEELLYLLYDEPEYVKEALNKITVLWHQFYNEFLQDMKASEYGNSDWSAVYSSKPSYIIQSDFSYMISNDMFKEFILPGLKYHCDHLNRIIYHLDGVGELNHLDDLLNVPNLNAIQWIPGSNGNISGNKPRYSDWDDVYLKILNGDKLLQIPYSLEDIEIVASKTNKKGYIEGLSGIYTKDDENYVRKMVDKIKSL